MEKANQDAPTFARILKDMIIVTHRDKPLPRVGKGSVARGGAVRMYQDEIEHL